MVLQISKANFNFKKGCTKYHATCRMHGTASAYADTGGIITLPSSSETRWLTTLNTGEREEWILFTGLLQIREGKHCKVSRCGSWRHCPAAGLCQDSSSAHSGSSLGTALWSQLHLTNRSQKNHSEWEDWLLSPNSAASAFLLSSWPTTTND